MSRPTKKKWIFYKHTNDYKRIQQVVLEIRKNNASIGHEDRVWLKNRMEDLDLYKPRSLKNESSYLDAINHNINTIKYFMFGYKAKIGKETKFMTSPLGNLYVRNIDEPQKLDKIFATMLYAIQFPHPANNQSSEFKIYPFRLIFKLLLDARLEGKLYDYEVITILVHIEDIDLQSYELLVEKIQKSRKLSMEEKKSVLLSNQDLHVTSCYEWQYYTKKILRDAQILSVEDGEEICRLAHPMKPKSKGTPTTRIAKSGSFSLREELKPLINELLNSEDTFTSEPVLFEEGKKFDEDYVKEIYAFYPKILLEELGESDNEIFNSKLLKLPELIVEYSLNKNNETADLFEDVLCKAFNLFSNVEARRIGGSGETDIECMHLEVEAGRNEKFAVDAKSTKKKLMQLSEGRLRAHRRNIGAKYTIIITPKYVPAVLSDIEGSDTYIIKANTFSEYIYNHLNLKIRDIDYDDIYELIKNNKGTDLSDSLSKKTVEKFGTMNGFYENKG